MNNLMCTLLEYSVFIGGGCLFFAALCLIEEFIKFLLRIPSRIPSNN